MQKITPFLWFDSQAEEAANLYVSLFADAEITGVSRYPEGAPGPAGEVMTVSFRLAGQEPSQCGWLKDRFGLSWQIVPTRLYELLDDPDQGRAQRAMQAMLQMSKIEIKSLEDAADAA
jgi:predicted 3-demethylubiquinone-9 3-methyltransferase (glyoxalase superfamily)